MKLRDLLQPIALGFEHVKQNHGLQVHSHVSQQNPVAEVLPSPNLLTNDTRSPRKNGNPPPKKKKQHQNVEFCLSWLEIKIYSPNGGEKMVTY